MAASTFRDVWIRVTPGLNQRLSVAAAAACQQRNRYCRSVVTLWANGAPGEEAPARVESGALRFRVPVSDKTHAKLRALAAVHDISVSDLVLRVVAAQVPDAVDIYTTLVSQE